MRFLFPIAALAALASAQDNTTAFLTQLTDALNGAGLTSLASAIQTVAGTTTGQSLLSILANGTTATVFAPTNNACK